MKEIATGILEVFIRPAKSIESAMKKKRWWIALIIILATQIIFSYVTNPITKNELANQLSDEQVTFFDKLQSLILIFRLFTIFLILVIASFFVYLFYKIAETDGLYVHFLSGVMYASLIDLVLGGAIRTLIVIIQKRTFSIANLAIFFPHLDIHSFSHILLAQIDLFSIWYLIALALGIASFAHISTRKSLMLIFIYWLFKIFSLSPLIYIFSKFLRF